MKAKQRWRYYCDYCKKALGQRYAMENHERGCTMNPNRTCGVCDNAVKPREVVVPDVANYQESAARLQVIRQACNNCPACILAVIRQNNSTYEYDFDFKAELKTWWEETNAVNESAYREMVGQ